MRSVLIALLALTATGCALRPRYGDFVTKETTAPVKVLLVEKKSGTPVAGAAIELGERSKVVVKTEADGTATLPLEKRFLDDNALLVVNAPAGVGLTEMSVAPVAPPVAQPEAAPAAPAEGAPATY
jgi:hypothetical protein